MKVTYESVKASSEIRTYHPGGRLPFLSLGFTEHSFAHVTRCAETAASLLERLHFLPAKWNWPKSPDICMTSAT